MPKLCFNDLIVTYNRDENGHLPIGEVDYLGVSKQPDSVSREAMLERLLGAVDYLMSLAAKAHLNEKHVITRLLTNEFFFYTEVPLKLDEFEQLQNQIYQKLQLLPEGVLFILGSFAVQTEKNYVMNITPHLMSGKTPQVAFFLKKTTSPVDFRYKNKDGLMLEALDLEAARYVRLPEICINNQMQPLTWQSFVIVEAPTQYHFFSAVDICLDHARGFAKRAVLRTLDTCPENEIYPVTQTIISQVIHIKKDESIGLVTQADPVARDEISKVAIETSYSGSTEGISFLKSFMVQKLYPQNIYPLVIEEVIYHFRQLKLYGPHAKKIEDSIDAFKAAYDDIETAEVARSKLEQLRKAQVVLSKLKSNQASIERVDEVWTQLLDKACFTIREYDLPAESEPSLGERAFAYFKGIFSSVRPDDEASDEKKKSTRKVYPK